MNAVLVVVVELETKVSEDYAKFYNHGEKAPTRVLDMKLGH